MLRNLMLLKARVIFLADIAGAKYQYRYQHHSAHPEQKAKVSIQQLSVAALAVSGSRSNRAVGDLGDRKSLYAAEIIANHLSPSSLNTSRAEKPQNASIDYRRSGHLRICAGRIRTVRTKQHIKTIREGPEPL